MRKKILVTGCSGFIGQALINVLQRTDENLEITGIDIKTPQTIDIDFIECDLANEDISKIIKQVEPEIIYHLGAQTNVRASIEAPELDYLTNVKGTINLLKGMNSSSQQRIVFTNSGGAIHSQPKRFPTPEDEKPSPNSPYGQNKLTATRLIKSESGSHGFNYAILNLSNIYGEEYPAKSAPAIFAEAYSLKKSIKIFGDGSATRDWVYIDDLVDALIKSGEASNNLDINVSTSQETSINSLISMINETQGHTLEIEYLPCISQEVQRSSLCNEKIRRDLEWEPKTSLDLGIKKLVTHYSRVNNATKV
jgi:UDP-glucose 4-epimerase